MTQEQFVKDFRAAMAIRGRTANEQQEARAWDALGHGQTEQFRSDALWHFERATVANFATAISDARQHAQERAAKRATLTGAGSAVCELCGGGGGIVFPKIYQAGRYICADPVRGKAKGETITLSHRQIIHTASDCPACRGGGPLPEPLLETWRERRRYSEAMGRHETCNEWARREATFILAEMYSPDEADGAGGWWQ